MIEKAQVEDPQERFQDFLKAEKYRQRFSQMVITGSTSIVVDFDDLLTADSELASEVIEDPDEYLEHANHAALAQLRIEEPEYAEGVERVNVRFNRLIETAPLRTLGSDDIGRFAMLEGIVVRATPVRPMVTRAAYQCKRCETVTYIDQTGPFLRDPSACTESTCRSRGPCTNKYNSVRIKCFFIIGNSIF